MENKPEVASYRFSINNSALKDNILLQSRRTRTMKNHLFFLLKQIVSRKRKTEVTQRRQERACTCTYTQDTIRNDLVNDMCVCELASC